MNTHGIKFTTTNTLSSRNQHRSEIDRQVTAFLKRGGKIDVIQTPCWSQNSKPKGSVWSGELQ